MPERFCLELVHDGYANGNGFKYFGFGFFLFSGKAAALLIESPSAAAFCRDFNYVRES